VCLAERSSRPHRSPAQVPAEEAERICELRERTGWSPGGLLPSRNLPTALHRPSGTQARRLLAPADPGAPVIVRYQWPCPGQLLHMDVKKFGKFGESGHAVTGDRTKRSRRVGWEYCHSIVDDGSAWPTASYTTTNAPTPSPPSRAAPWTGSSITVSSPNR
jgi:hypothetical protein